MALPSIAQGAPWQWAGLVDTNGNPLSSSNGSVSNTGASVPSQATYMGGNESGNLVGLSLDASGFLKVNVAAGGGAGGTSSSFGVAFPGTGTAAGINDGTSMQGMLAESAANPNLRIALYSAATKLIGQAAMSASIPVVLASNQTDIPINTDKIGGSAYALGQAAMSASAPVVIASNQTDVPINIDKVGASALTLGQNTKANSVPVTMASDQGNTPVTQQVGTSGGSTPYHNLTANTTNFTNVKGVATKLYKLKVGNTSASVIYVKLYDKATAPGTGDTPVATYMVNANTTLIEACPEGTQFSTGFGWAATGAVANNDNTAIAANCIVDYCLGN